VEGDEGQAEGSAASAAGEVASEWDEEAKKWNGGSEAVTAPLRSRERPRRAAGGDTAEEERSVSGDRKDEADQRSTISQLQASSARQAEQ